MMKGGGQSFNSDSSKITQNSSPNEKKVIDTKRSFGKAKLLSSIITPEGQSILRLMMSNWLLKHHVFVQEWNRGVVLILFEPLIGRFI